MIALDRLDRLNVRLLLTTGDDPFQAAIRMSTSCEASHAALAIGRDGEQLLHAYEQGVQLDERARWIAMGQRVVAEYQIVPDVTDGVFCAMGHVGKRYDVLHIAKLAVMRMFRLVRLGRPEDDRAFTCARFVMTIDPDGVLIPEWRTISRDAAVPRDLWDAADRGPSFHRLA